MTLNTATGMVELHLHSTHRHRHKMEDEIDDDTFAKGLHEKVKAENFAAGLPIFYQEDENDMDCQWYTVEYPDGTKKRVHVDELETI